MNRLVRAALGGGLTVGVAAGLALGASGSASALAPTTRVTVSDPIGDVQLVRHVAHGVAGRQLQAAASTAPGVADLTRAVFTVRRASRRPSLVVKAYATNAWDGTGTDSWTVNNDLDIRIGSASFDSIASATGCSYGSRTSADRLVQTVRIPLSCLGQDGIVRGRLSVATRSVSSAAGGGPATVWRDTTAPTRVLRLVALG